MGVHPRTSLTTTTTTMTVAMRVRRGGGSGQPMSCKHDIGEPISSDDDDGDGEAVRRRTMNNDEAVASMKFTR